MVLWEKVLQNTLNYKYYLSSLFMKGDSRKKTFITIKNALAVKHTSTSFISGNRSNRKFLYNKKFTTKWTLSAHLKQLHQGATDVLSVFGRQVTQYIHHRVHLWNFLISSVLHVWTLVSMVTKVFQPTHKYSSYYCIWKAWSAKIVQFFILIK